MTKSKLTKNVLFALVLTLFFSTNSIGAGWCGQSKKVHCGGWVVQMNWFWGNASIENNDCVNYSGCVSQAEWTWNKPGVWMQNLVEKEGFCGKNYKISNTKDFNVKYSGSFSNSPSGRRRLAIVSWAKTADNCNWTTNNLYELYIHERSYGESDDYSGWCTPKGESATCSGSKYKLYDCGNQIIGRALRCWRKSQRLSGTTDVDCLWESWRSKGIAPDVYYYFTEVGTEVGPNSKGKFKLSNPNMTRVAESGSSGGSGGGSSSSIVNNGVYNLTCSWGNKNLNVTGNWSGANVNVRNQSNGDWSQMWILRKFNTDRYRLQNRWTGKYLHNTGTSNNANVTANNLNNNWGSQKWRFRKVSGDVYRIENLWAKKYLTGQNTNNGYAKIHALNNNWSSQKWTLKYRNVKARQGVVEEKIDPENPIYIYNSPTGMLSIAGEEMHGASVYSLDGRLVWSSNLSVTDTYEIDSRDFQKGIYVVKVSGKNNELITKKAIVR